MDKDKLSNNYSIEPYNWINYRSNDSYYRYEREEVVNKNIRNLNRYIIQIDIHKTFHKNYISSDEFESIINNAKDSRYDINLVDK